MSLGETQPRHVDGTHGAPPPQYHAVGISTQFSNTTWSNDRMTSHPESATSVVARGMITEDHAHALSQTRQHRILNPRSLTSSARFS
jgi:hypothetical protein